MITNSFFALLKFINSQKKSYIYHITNNNFSFPPCRFLCFQFFLILYMEFNWFLSFSITYTMCRRLFIADCIFQPYNIYWVCGFEDFVQYTMRNKLRQRAIVSTPYNSNGRIFPVSNLHLIVNICVYRIYLSHILTFWIVYKYCN